MSSRFVLAPLACPLGRTSSDGHCLVAAAGDLAAPGLLCSAAWRDQGTGTLQMLGLSSMRSSSTLRLMSLASFEVYGCGFNLFPLLPPMRRPSIASGRFSLRSSSTLRAMSLMVWLQLRFTPTSMRLASTLLGLSSIRSSSTLRAMSSTACEVYGRGLNFGSSSMRSSSTLCSMSVTALEVYGRGFNLVSLLRR